MLPPPSAPHPFSQCFRARVYNYTGTQIWPQAQSNADCVGGSLRAVTGHENAALGAGTVPGRGFQPKFVGLGGSMATLLAPFPNQGQAVNSYFWCTPGVEMMTDNPFRGSAIHLNMTEFATNALLETHYDDFINHAVWNVSHSY